MPHAPGEVTSITGIAAETDIVDVHDVQGMRVVHTIRTAGVENLDPGACIVNRPRSARQVTRSVQPDRHPSSRLGTRDFSGGLLLSLVNQRTAYLFSSKVNKQ